MAIAVRVAESDADLEAWRRVRRMVLPDERALPIEEMRAMRAPEVVYMRALNERLGYVTRSESVTVRGPLPLEGAAPARGGRRPTPRAGSMAGD